MVTAIETENQVMKMIIPKVDGKYGAPMGRVNIGENPQGRVFDRYVPLSGDGAYDMGGAYWGIGARLRVSFTKDLAYIRFYREGE